MKFRKLPVVIDAIQFGPDCRSPLFDGHAPVNFGVPHTDGDAASSFDGVYWVQTLEGALRVSDGDWIICGTKGEFYPCKPDIFATNYEPITPERAICGTCGHQRNYHDDVICLHTGPEANGGCDCQGFVYADPREGVTG